MLYQFKRPFRLMSLESYPLQYSVLRTTKPMIMWMAQYLCEMKESDAILYAAREVGKGFYICVTGTRDIWRFTGESHLEKVRIFNMPGRRYAEASNDEALKTRI